MLFSFLLSFHSSPTCTLILPSFVCVLCLVSQSGLTIWDPMDCSPPGSSVRGDSPGKNTRVSGHVLNTGVGCHPPPGDLPNSGIEPRSATLPADSLSSEPPGKSKNTGVGSLSLLQVIFLTQESNLALLHCRRILYQLSYQGSPIFCLLLENVYTIFILLRVLPILKFIAVGLAPFFVSEVVLG